MVAAGHRRRGIGRALLDAGRRLGARASASASSSCTSSRTTRRRSRSTRRSASGARATAGALPPRRRLRRRDPDGLRRTSTTRLRRVAAGRDRRELLQAAGPGPRPLRARQAGRGGAARARARAGVKLASNEGPFGPFPEALEALAAAAPELNRYPDGGGYRLRAALAERHGVRFEEIALGAGADGVVDCLAQVSLDPGRRDRLRLAVLPELRDRRAQARRCRPGRSRCATDRYDLDGAARRDHRRGRSSSTSATRTTRPGR